MPRVSDTQQQNPHCSLSAPHAQRGYAGRARSYSSPSNAMRLTAVQQPRQAAVRRALAAGEGCDEIEHGARRQTSRVRGRTGKSASSPANANASPDPMDSDSSLRQAASRPTLRGWLVARRTRKMAYRHWQPRSAARRRRRRLEVSGLESTIGPCCEVGCAVWRGDGPAAADGWRWIPACA